MHKVPSSQNKFSFCKQTKLSATFTKQVCIPVRKSSFFFRRPLIRVLNISQHFSISFSWKVGARSLLGVHRATVGEKTRVVINYKYNLSFTRQQVLEGKKRCPRSLEYRVSLKAALPRKAWKISISVDCTVKMLHLLRTRFANQTRRFNIWFAEMLQKKLRSCLSVHA